MFIYSMFLLMTLPFCLDYLADGVELQENLNTLAATFDGRVGICVLRLGSSGPMCVKGEETFPLQSVMKLIVAASVMDLVDRGELRLSEVVVVKPEDGSPGPDEFARLVRSHGTLRVPIEELVRRAIIDSDSTSVDVLIERIGGIGVVQKFLSERKIEGIRVDRNERDLQAESVGLTWRPEFADSRAFDAAVKQQSEENRDAAWRASLRDLRDTATPLGMVNFLSRLASGTLLSTASTRKLLAVMEETSTGRDRLRAGIPSDWIIGHKTGTGLEWKGVASTTNDVGVLTAPDGGKVAVAVFVAESRSSGGATADLIAAVAKSVTSAYRLAGNTEIK